MSLSNGKTVAGLAGAALIVGMIVGMFLTDKLFHPGCTLKLNIAPPSIETDCPSPYETAISFGSSPSERSLGAALSILQERTQGMGQARIFISDEVLSSDLSSKIVHPPSGSQGTITVRHQLLDESGGSNLVDICLAPSGGFRVQLGR